MSDDQSQQLPDGAVHVDDFQPAAVFNQIAGAPAQAPVPQTMEDALALDPSVVEQSRNNAMLGMGSIGKALPLTSADVLMAKGVPEAASAAQKLQALRQVGGNNTLVQPTAQQLIEQAQKATGNYGKVIGKPFAEGGEVPEGAIPVHQFETSAPAVPEGAIPADQFESSEDKYGSLGQKALTAVEGAGQGLLGPIAPIIEKHIFHTRDADILGRQNENPISHGIGQGAGLVGGAMTGMGEGALMGKAGEAAVGMTGLNDAAQVAKAAGAVPSLGNRVGSEAVKQAAEMAVLQGSDETSKLVLNDPDTSAQSAIGNIGLSAALGGAGGAFMAGAVNPLWNATVGPKVDHFLTGLSEHLNGTKGLAMAPEAITNAEKELGMQLSPEMRAGLSGDPKAAMLFNELREAQHPKILAGIDTLRKDSSEAVIKALGIAPEDIANYSENSAGHDLIDTFKKEYGELYQPVQAKYDALKTDNAHVNVADEDKLNQYARLVEKGQQFGAQGSPFQKMFDDYGSRLLEQKNVGQVDKLVSEIGNEMRKAYRAGDSNTYQALKEIKSSMQDFTDSQIDRIAANAEKSGIANARVAGNDLINKRAEASAQYARVAKISDEMASHLGLGEFKGAQRLMQQLAEKKSPEQVLKNLSPKGNADIIPFMQKYFPQTLDKVRENELKQLVRPAILGAKNDEPINLKTLSNALDKHMAGQKEYTGFVLPQSTINKVQAAKQLQDALPAFKSSGTAGWQSKLNQYMPQSAAAAVSLLTGHNPIAGYVTGHVAQLLAKDAPEAIKLGMLRFLSSDQPIKSEGFKTMIDYMAQTYKGQTTLARATNNMFKAGAQVLTTNQMPSDKDREKLDKQVTKLQESPDLMLKTQDQHLGHYMPQHQTATSQTVTAAAQYLQGLKPQPKRLGPLDTPIEPTHAETARYNRALDIANQPLVVLQHAKNGTIMPTDIKDLNSMYPALYKQMVQKVSNQMTAAHGNEESIPYRTRIGLSLFLGQAVDTSMTPSSIQSAQMANMPPQAKPGMQQEQAPKSKGKPSALGKTNKSYMTPEQSSEERRLNKD